MANIAIRLCHKSQISRTVMIRLLGQPSREEMPVEAQNEMTKSFDDAYMHKGEKQRLNWAFFPLGEFASAQRSHIYLCSQ